jgi:hypothetical protein
VVSETNSRYFSVASDVAVERRAVYLTGSHIWNNLHDGMGPGPDCAASAEVFDYNAYLAFLKQRGHNFIRLWRWEQFRSQAAGGGYHLCMTPQPWARTGPGNANDGNPRFDLDSFDAAFFDRLRERVISAGKEGIYVAVMLFDGFALHLSPAPDNVEGHPFHSANNINGIGIRSIVDYQVLPIDPRIQAYQEAYVRNVIDTVHDLPNVLWEVANESSGGGSADKGFATMLGLDDVPDWGDSTEWQYWVINVVKSHEREMGYHPHPIGMTMQFPVADQTKVNEPLFQSRADWISPGYDDEIFTGGRHPMAPGSPPSRWLDDPPAADGRKVIISDTDHFAPGRGDALWAWKAFLRGHHPILMDFGIIEGVSPADPSTSAAPGIAPFAAFESARYAMGDTRRYADRVGLISMEPQGDLASTRFALVNPGEEYLVLQPDGGRSFTIDLAKGAYKVEWFAVDLRVTERVSDLRVEAAGPVEFTAPFTQAESAALYLKRLASASGRHRTKTGS